MRLINIPQELKQPNGQIINCFASGNEHFNFLHDKNGCVIIQREDTGYYVYAINENNQLVASQYAVTEETLNNIDVSTIYENIVTVNNITNIMVNRNNLAKNTPNLALKSEAEPDILNTPKTGLINSITVFVRFSDESEFTTLVSDYQNMFNSNTANYNSMYNYFQANTYGQLSVYSYFYPTTEGATVVSYQDANPRSYYQPYNAITNPNGYTDANRTAREQTLIYNAVNAISAQVPNNINVDQDNDGYVDNVCFVIKGAPGAWASILWPHQWQLFSYTTTIHGARVYPYIIQLQDVLNVGVLCHETLHSVGFPDLYHYNFDGLDPVYQWDIMDYDLNPPEHSSSYTKYRYGTWISSIPQITTSGTYTLNPLTSSTNNCYMIRSQLNNTQYFVVEYRLQNSVFENSLPGSGLLVYRVNTAQDGQGNAGGPPDELYLYRPGGTTTANGTPASANLGLDVGRTSIGGPGNPLFFADGTPSEIIINNIGSAGNTISFDVNLGVAPQSADIAISNISEPSAVGVGDTFNYIITVVNNGPDTSQGVVFTHTLSPYVNYVSAVSSQGSMSFAGGVITGNIGDMPSGATVTITITVTAITAGTVNNTFNVIGTTYDPNLANNTASGTIVITAQPQPTADIAISNVSQPTTVNLGVTFDYVITVVNNGPDTSNGVVFTHTLSPNVTYVSGISTQGTVSYAGGVVSCNIGSMTNGATVTVTITVTATSVGTVNNTFNVSSQTFDPNLVNNTASASTQILLVPSADIAIINVVEPYQVYVGQSFDYEITVVNNGPDISEDVIFTHTLSPNVTYVSGVSTQGIVSFAGGVVTGSIGDMAIGQIVIITITVTAVTESTLNNTFTVNSITYDPDLSNNTATGTTQIVSPPQDSADIAITNVVQPLSVTIGQTFSYEITIENNGPDTSQGVVFTNTISPLVTYISATSTQGTVSFVGGVLTANIGDMNNGDIVTVTITVMANTVGTLVNVFNVSATTYDPNPANNTATVTTQIQQVPQAKVSTGVRKKCHGLCEVYICIKNTTSQTVDIGVNIYGWNNGTSIDIWTKTVTIAPNGLVKIPIRAKNLPCLYEIVFSNVVQGVYINISNIYKGHCGYYKCIAFRHNDLIVK